PIAEHVDSAHAFSAEYRHENPPHDIQTNFRPMSRLSHNDNFSSVTSSGFMSSSSPRINPSDNDSSYRYGIDRSIVSSQPLRPEIPTMWRDSIQGVNPSQGVTEEQSFSLTNTNLESRSSSSGQQEVVTLKELYGDSDDHG